MSVYEKGDMFEFIKKFVHLGSTITFVMGGTIDVKNRMEKK